MQNTGADFSNIYEVENLRCRISALSSLLCPGKKEIFIIYRIHWNTIGRVFFFFFAFEQYIRNFASVPCGLDIRRYRYFCINVFVTIVRGQFKDLNGKWAT